MVARRSWLASSAAPGWGVSTRGWPRDIARQMFLSEHTVQDHLKSIFEVRDTERRTPARPSCRSRSGLMHVAPGTSETWRPTP